MSNEENRARPPSSAGGRPPEPKFLETAAIAQGSDTAPSRPPVSLISANAWIGRSLGKYQITAVLGQGGMGIVFKAHDPLIDRDVAIKLLPEELAEDETALGRFLAEAKAVGRLNHQNVVSVYDVGQDGKAYYLVMELMPGGSAAERLDRGQSCSVLDATRIAIDACKGLAAAHATGLIHRDVKPANLMRGTDGAFKITDFGLAKTTTPRTREITQAGMVVGTPYFMSPEQCDAKPVDARSDIYSLGATYYSLLSGRSPYEDYDSVLQVMFGHCQGDIPDPRTADPSIPMACAAIVARAMAKSPADRYQTAGEMLADLEAVAAKLSGPVRIDLPSQSGVRGVPSPSAAHGAARATGGSRALWISGAAAAAVLVALALAIWRPWSRRSRDFNPPPNGPLGCADRPPSIRRLAAPSSRRPEASRRRKSCWASARPSMAPRASWVDRWKSG